MCFWGVMTFDLIFTFYFEAIIIDFNWLWMISSVFGRYLAKRLLDCFHTAQTHPRGGVNVPFWGYELWPICLPLILWPLLTLIDVHHHVWPWGRASVFRFRTIYLKPLAWLPSYCIHTSLRGYGCAFRWLWPFTYFFTFGFGAIIDFNWLWMISSVSGRNIAKRSLDCFYTAHTHPLGMYICLLGLWPFT